MVAVASRSKWLFAWLLGRMTHCCMARHRTSWPAAGCRGLPSWLDLCSCKVFCLLLAQPCACARACVRSCIVERGRGMLRRTQHALPGSRLQRTTRSNSGSLDETPQQHPWNGLLYIANLTHHPVACRETVRMYVPPAGTARRPSQHKPPQCCCSCDRRKHARVKPTSVRADMNTMHWVHQHHHMRSKGVANRVE